MNAIARPLNKTVAAATTSASNVGHFYFFKSPTVLMPTLDLNRRLFNPINRLIYNYVDKEYNYEGFMDGAVQAVLISALDLRERRLDKFREISTESLINYLRRRLPELADDQLAQRLTFGREHIVTGFIHSSIWSIKNLSTRLWLDNEDSGFHATLAFYIDKTGKWARPLDEVMDEEVRRTVNFSGAPGFGKILKAPEDWLVCNMTLSRKIPSHDAPCGRWRISDLNFFDCAFAMDTVHSNY